MAFIWLDETLLCATPHLPGDVWVEHKTGRTPGTYVQGQTCSVGR